MPEIESKFKPLECQLRILYPLSPTNKMAPPLEVACLSSVHTRKYFEKKLPKGRLADPNFMPMHDGSVAEAYQIKGPESVFHSRASEALSESQKEKKKKKKSKLSYLSFARVISYHQCWKWFSVVSLHKKILLLYLLVYIFIHRLDTWVFGSV